MRRCASPTSPPTRCRGLVWTLPHAMATDNAPVRCPITVAGHVASVYRGRVENDAIDFDGNDVAVFEVR